MDLLIWFSSNRLFLQPLNVVSLVVVSLVCGNHPEQNPVYAYSLHWFPGQVGLSRVCFQTKYKGRAKQH